METLKPELQVERIFAIQGCYTWSVIRGVTLVSVDARSEGMIPEERASGL